VIRYHVPLQSATFVTAMCSWLQNRNSCLL